MTKEATWGEGGLFPLTVAIMGESQGRNLKTGTKAETMRNIAHWLASQALLSWLSYTRQEHLPKGGTIHSGLTPLTSITHQENAMAECLQAI